MYGRLETCGRLSIGLSGLRRTLMLSVAYAFLRAVSGIVPTLRSRVSTNRRVPQRFLDLVVQAKACATQMLAGSHVARPTVTVLPATESCAPGRVCSTRMYARAATFPSAGEKAAEVISPAGDSPESNFVPGSGGSV